MVTARPVIFIGRLDRLPIRPIRQHKRHSLQFFRLARRVEQHTGQLAAHFLGIAKRRLDHLAFCDFNGRPGLCAVETGPRFSSVEIGDGDFSLTLAKGKGAFFEKSWESGPLVAAGTDKKIWEGYIDAFFVGFAKVGADTAAIAKSAIGRADGGIVGRDELGIGSGVDLKFKGRAVELAKEIILGVRGGVGVFFAGRQQGGQKANTKDVFHVENFS